MINSFYGIGWADPFVENNAGIGVNVNEFKIPTDPDDDVYESCRYVQKYSPYVIYVPKK